MESPEGKLAQWITDFSGSMHFVYFHFFWFVLWIMVNHSFFEPLLSPFDPFPYGLLTMIVSLEAIFLSTFIMIAQKRQSLIDEYRELEEDIEEKESEEEVEDIQKDLDEIKKAMQLIRKKIMDIENRA